MERAEAAEPKESTDRETEPESDFSPVSVSRFEHEKKAPENKKRHENNINKNAYFFIPYNNI